MRRRIPENLKLVEHIVWLTTDLYSAAEIAQSHQHMFCALMEESAPGLVRWMHHQNIGCRSFFLKVTCSFDLDIFLPIHSSILMLFSFSCHNKAQSMLAELLHHHTPISSLCSFEASDPPVPTVPEPSTRPGVTEHLNSNSYTTNRARLIQYYYLHIIIFNLFFSVSCVFCSFTTAVCIQFACDK